MSLMSMKVLTKTEVQGFVCVCVRVFVHQNELSVLERHSQMLLWI